MMKGLFGIMKRRTQIVVGRDAYEEFTEMLDKMGVDYSCVGLCWHGDLETCELIVEIVSNKEAFEALGYNLFTVPWRKQVGYDKCKFGKADEI